MSETTGQSMPSGQTHGPHDAAPDPAPAEHGSALPPPYPPPPTSPPRPPLLRSRDDRMIAGVAGGLGRTFGVDPVLFRVVLAVLALAGGTGLLLYLLLWVLVPEEGSDGSSVADRWVRSRSWSTATVLILAVGVAIVFGVVLGLDPTPLIVLGVIATVIFLLVRRDPRPTGPATVQHYGPAVPPAAYVPPRPYAQVTQPYSTSAATSATSATQPIPPAAVSDAYAADAVPPTSAPPPPTAPYPPLPVPPPPPRPPKEKSALGVLTLGLAAVTAGVLTAVRLAGDTSTPTTTVILAVTALVIGLGLLVGAVAGRARWLVIPGLILVLFTAGSATAHNFDGPRGSRTFAPTTAAQVQPHYEWGAGELVLDLSAVEDNPDLTISAELGVGSLRVIVPDGAALRGTADVGVGSIRLPDGTEHDGFGPDADLSTSASGVKPATGQTITLDLRVGLGEVVVSRA